MFQKWHATFGDYLLAQSRIARVGRKKILLAIARVSYALWGDILEGRITLRAMSLVYTTLLAIVPLLAVSFSVLKGFGIHNRMESILSELLAPLGEQKAEVIEYVVGFVENIDVGVLGILGFAFLFYSAFSLIQKVDQAFNELWHVKKGRSLFRRVSDYLTVFMLGPILIFTSMGLSATLMNSDITQQILAMEPFGTLYRNLVRFIPYALNVIAFTFFYTFLPIPRVRLKPALIGGLVSGAAWQFSGWIFALVVVSSTKYIAIYSGFAILLFFMIWVYVNWLILLLGARVVYFLQHPAQLNLAKNHLQINLEDKEHLALNALCVIGRAFYAGKQGADARQINAALNLPSDLLDEIMDILKQANLVVEAHECDDFFIPACPFDDTSVKQALDAIRRAPAGHGRLNIAKPFPKISDLLQKFDQTTAQIYGEVSLKQLILEDI